MKNICLCFILVQSFLYSQGVAVNVTQDSATTHKDQATTAPAPHVGVPETYNTDCKDKLHAENVLLEKPDDDVILTCAPKDGVKVNGNLRWFKKDKEITTDSVDYKRFNYSLQVVKVGASDVGEYFCLINVDQLECNVSVHLESAPQIKHFEPDYKNLVQGDPLVLECNMWGWPYPKVSWAINGSALNATDSRVTIQPNSHGVPNAKLRLVNVDYPDGGVYSCVGTNEHNESNSSITVYIKSKYAALLPFLGICAEVAILCTIIFIYERRHAKKLAEEEEEEAKQEEAEHLASNNEKKEFDDVRHRDVKT